MNSEAAKKLCLESMKSLISLLPDQRDKYDVLLSLVAPRQDSIEDKKLLQAVKEYFDSKNMKINELETQISQKEGQIKLMEEKGNKMIALAKEMIMDVQESSEHVN